MPVKVRKRQSHVAAVEQDVLDATIDVCVEDWRNSASSQAALVVGPQAWRQVAGAWSPGVCGGLCTVADTLELLSGEPHLLVEWMVAALLQAHGVPPFIARVIGRLVANWLLSPLDPMGKAATRLRVLGVLLCLEAGDLGDCPCLEQLGQELAIDALKRELAEDLGIAPQSGEPSPPRAAPPRFATMTEPVAGPADWGQSSHDVSAAHLRRQSSATRERRQYSAAEPGTGPPGPGARHHPSGPPDHEPPDISDQGPAGPSGPGPGSAGPSGPEPAGPSGPEPARPAGQPPSESMDDPDPRLRVACDDVRGARRVPTSAIFGAASNAR